MLVFYAKMALYEVLLSSDAAEDPYLAADLAHYLLKPLRKIFTKAMHGHRLRREIIATFVVNSFVNRAGPSFVSDIVDGTGAALADVARVCSVAREAFAPQPTARRSKRR